MPAEFGSTLDFEKTKTKLCFTDEEKSKLLVTTTPLKVKSVFVMDLEYISNKTFTNESQIYLGPDCTCSSAI